jgi:coproporphyrinogen III oxidase-like Fe-S oxidoreductase
MAERILAAAGLAATIETRPLSMEDTFVSVLHAAGFNRA